MKLLMTLVITLFLSGLVTFLVAGLPAQERARVEHADLIRRIDELRDARVSLPPVSHAVAEGLAAEHDRLEELGNRRLAMLTDQRYAAPHVALGTTLQRTGLAALENGMPLRAQVLEWAGESADTSYALSRLVNLMDESGIRELESLDRRPTDSLGLTELPAESYELVVVSEMEDVLAFLEELVPGRGEPTLSVTGASLRRIDPGLWSTTPVDLATPPVRLWVRVEAHHIAPNQPGGP